MGGLDRHENDEGLRVGELTFRRLWNSFKSFSSPCNEKGRPWKTRPFSNDSSNGNLINCRQADLKRY